MVKLNTKASKIEFLFCIIFLLIFELKFSPYLPNFWYGWKFSKSVAAFSHNKDQNAQLLLHKVFNFRWDKVIAVAPYTTYFTICGVEYGPVPSSGYDEICGLFFIYKASAVKYVEVDGGTYFLLGLNKYKCGASPDQAALSWYLDPMDKQFYLRTK